MLTFNYDTAFNESYRQEALYHEAVRPLVRSVIEGQSGCVILFGPTDAGKSFTIKGGSGQSGIVFKAVEDLLQWSKDNTVEKRRSSHDVPQFESHTEH